MEENSRGARTREAILAASRRLFLERGYAGTSVNAITEECGISRAGLYTYFKDKREVFNALGETAYHDVLDILSGLGALTRPLRSDEVEAWVETYFRYLDAHGAFVFAAAHSAPEDDDFRRSRDRMLTRTSFMLGHALGGGAGHPPEVVGITLMGMLDRSWHSLQAQSVPVDRTEMVAMAADVLIRATWTA